MLNVFVGKCDRCGKEYTVIHTNWDSREEGGVLENPMCPHCKRAWAGYSFVRNNLEARLGALVIWAEEPVDALELVKAAI
jgi:hypothetical protein